jgi:PrtD family type I secretion system ABC transporter
MWSGIKNSRIFGLFRSYLLKSVSAEFTPSHDVAAALNDCRRAFWSVALFSGVVNLLMLAGPLYMLQIYDRVLAARSVPTLVALSVFLVGAYLFQGALDIIRSRIVVRVAALLDRNLGTTVHAAVMSLAIQSRHAAEAQQPVRDLDQIRSFLTSPGPIAIVDLPWMPFFLAICFLIHSWLGFVALAGSCTLLVVTILNERASRAPAHAVAKDAGLRAATIEADRRNSETAVAMGMGNVLAKRWAAINARYITALARAGDVVSSYASVSKVLRLLLQSAILGLGAYLVIYQELTPGSMIAASIMMGRALAPIETAIANWRGFIAARQSTKRLSQTLARLQPRRSPTALPKPVSGLEVEKLTVAAPGSETPIVKDVHFRLSAGDVLGIIGPNGAGKTSLIRTLVGIWRPSRGEVRIDGAPFEQWDPEFIGRHIGFVSQGAELFDGTVAENISRMQIGSQSEAVLQAARAAGAHVMILRLPDGYDTRIGEAGAVLSAGQRQRIAIARAVYGDPFLVVLDEPNANLDNDGEVMLQETIRALKARGAIVITAAHRPSAVTICDKLLFLSNGAQQAFGPRDEVLQKVLVRPAPPAAKGSDLKVVRNLPGGGDR